MKHIARTHYIEGLSEKGRGKEFLPIHRLFFTVRLAGINKDFLQGHTLPPREGQQSLGSAERRLA